MYAYLQVPALITDKWIKLHVAHSYLANFSPLSFLFQYKPGVEATELALAFPLPDNVRSPPSSRVSKSIGHLHREDMYIGIMVH